MLKVDTRGVADKAEKGLSLLRVIVALAVGFATAIAVGRVVSEGAAEIAGVMSASLVICLRVFGEYRQKAWFTPLTGGWIVVHLATLLFWIIPSHPAGSKLLVQLVWPEFLGFAGLMWLATLLWGDLPTEPLE